MINTHFSCKYSLPVFSTKKALHTTCTIQIAFSQSILSMGKYQTRREFCALPNNFTVKHSFYSKNTIEEIIKKLSNRAEKTLRVNSKEDNREIYFIESDFDEEETQGLYDFFTYSASNFKCAFFHQGIVSEEPYETKEMQLKNQFSPHYYLSQEKGFNFGLENLAYSLPERLASHFLSLQEGEFPDQIGHETFFYISHYEQVKRIWNQVFDQETGIQKQFYQEIKEALVQMETETKSDYRSQVESVFVNIRKDNDAWKKLLLELGTRAFEESHSKTPFPREIHTAFQMAFKLPKVKVVHSTFSKTVMCQGRSELLLNRIGEMIPRLPIDCHFVALVAQHNLSEMEEIMEKIQTTASPLQLS